MVLVCTADDPALKITLPVYQITSIGKQVLRLGSFEPHEEYLKQVGCHLKEQGIDVVLARYVPCGSDRIRYYNGQKL